MKSTLPAEVRKNFSMEKFLSSNEDGANMGALMIGGWRTPKNECPHVRTNFIDP